VAGDRVLEESITRRGERLERRLTTNSLVRELGADEGLEAEVTDRGRQTRSGEREVSNGKGALASDEEAVAARRLEAPERARIPGRGCGMKQARGAGARRKPSRG